MEFGDIREIEDRGLIETYRKLPIALVSGSGVWVTDTGGKRYLDLYGGHAVAVTGHCHPCVVRAIQEQASRLLFYSNLVYSDIRALAVARLTRFAPEGMKAYFCGSGTEANETALKIARMLTGRPGVVAMEGSFHGRTLGAVSVTGLPPYRDKVGPIVPGTTFVPFGDEEAARAVIGPDTAAVILEPIQSMAGIREAAPPYYKALRDVCDERGAFLIFDEVQTAPARTGAPFYGDHVGVVPDLITTAKGIASGVPCGLVLASASIASRIAPGDHGTTFGGGPLACAALAATLEVIETEELVENARLLGDLLTRGMKALDGVEDVRGRGLLLGAVLDRPAGPVRDALIARRILVGTAPGDPNVLRLLPPLTLTPDEMEGFLDVLADVLRKGNHVD